MKINKDDKVIDALYEENKMLRKKMNKQKETMYSFIDTTIEKFVGSNDTWSRAVRYTLQVIKEFCEKNIWNE